MILTPSFRQYNFLIFHTSFFSLFRTVIVNSTIVGPVIPIAIGRTHNLPVKSRKRCQLSYEPNCGASRN